MKALTIAAVSLRRFFRNRSNIFAVFLFPMLLVLLLGSGGGTSTPRLGFHAETADELSAQLLEGLESIEGLAVTEFDSEDATVRAVERGEIEAALMVPAGYTSTLQSGGDVELRYVSRTQAGQFQGIDTAIGSVVGQQLTLLRTARFAEQQGAGSFGDALALAAEVQVTLPPVEVVATTAGEPFALTGLGPFDLYAQTMLVLFVFLTTLQGAAALVESRRLGVSRRMISTPTPARTVLLGEGLSRLAIALVQGLVVFVGTWLIFGVDWGDPLPAFIVLLVFAVVSSGAAMLLGAVASNDQQAGTLGTTIGLGLAALGGAMIPLVAFEFLSDTVWRVAHVTPHAWALESFEELVGYGGGFSEIAGFLLILLGYAAVFFTLGIWRLRVTLTR